MAASGSLLSILKAKGFLLGFAWFWFGELSAAAVSGRKLNLSRNDSVLVLFGRWLRLERAFNAVGLMTASARSEIEWFCLRFGRRKTWRSLGLWSWQANGLPRSRFDLLRGVSSSLVETLLSEKVTRSFAELALLLRESLLTSIGRNAMPSQGQSIYFQSSTASANYGIISLPQFPALSGRSRSPGEG